MTGDKTESDYGSMETSANFSKGAKNSVNNLHLTTKHPRTFEPKIQTLAIPFLLQPGNTVPPKAVGRASVTKDLLFSAELCKEQRSYLSGRKSGPETDKHIKREIVGPVPWR